MLKRGLLGVRAKPVNIQNEIEHSFACVGSGTEASCRACLIIVLHYSVSIQTDMNKYEKRAIPRAHRPGPDITPGGCFGVWFKSEQRGRWSKTQPGAVFRQLAGVSTRRISVVAPRQGTQKAQAQCAIKAGIARQLL